ncbi:hypothetical protein IANJMKHF_00116 [Klebsiella phage CPRSA]|nr:hypothetical protein IANJMKHF_00116 [Klebsiella phage CPRSA]
MEEFSVKQLLDLENLLVLKLGKKWLYMKNSNSLMSSHTQQIENLI